jgi:hypothetical protein
MLHPQIFIIINPQQLFIPPMYLWLTQWKYFWLWTMSVEDLLLQQLTVVVGGMR